MIFTKMADSIIRSVTMKTGKMKLKPSLKFEISTTNDIVHLEFRSFMPWCTIHRVSSPTLCDNVKE